MMLLKKLLEMQLTTSACQYITRVGPTLVAVVLAFAAASKTMWFANAVREGAQPNLFSESSPIVFCLEFVIAFGLVMYPRLSWLTATVFFLPLTFWSMHLWGTASPSCGCFGAIHVSPMYVVAFDVLALPLLIAFGVKEGQLSIHRWLLVPVLTFSSGAALGIGLQFLAVWHPQDAVTAAFTSTHENEVQWALESNSLELKFVNNSARAVLVDGLRASCDCVQLPQSSLRLAPDSEEAIQVGVDDYRAFRRPTLAKQATVAVSVTGTITDRQQVWHGQKLVRFPFEEQNELRSLEPVELGDSATATYKLTPLWSIRTLWCESTPDAEAHVVQNADKVELEVRFAADSAGMHEAVVSVFGQSDGIEQAFEYPLTFRWEVTADVTAYPTALVLFRNAAGTLFSGSAGTLFSGSLEFRSRSHAEFSIESAVLVNNPDATIRFVAESAVGNKTLHLEVAPEELTTAYTDTLLVTILADGGASRYSLKIPLTLVRLE